MTSTKRRPWSRSAFQPSPQPQLPDQAIASLFHSGKVAGVREGVGSRDREDLWPTRQPQRPQLDRGLSGADRTGSRMMRCPLSARHPRCEWRMRKVGPALLPRHREDAEFSEGRRRAPRRRDARTFVRLAVRSTGGSSGGKGACARAQPRQTGGVAEVGDRASLGTQAMRGQQTG